MADYPATLPVPRITGYSVSPVDGAARTDMDAGNVRARRRFVSVPDMVDVMWLFSDAEMSAFRGWFADDAAGAAGGAGWFNLDIAVGNDIETKAARFSEPWSAALMPGLHWQVSAKLEVR